MALGKKVEGEPDGYKLCPRCKSLKVYGDFHKDKASRHGVACYCKECANTSSTKHHHARMKDVQYRDSRNEAARLFGQERKSLAVKYKQSKCLDCGGSYPDCVYDFHHLDPSTKDYNPSTSMKLSLEVMYAELDKCVMLCSNCHRIRHFGKD